jgi:hypothetical protein
MSASPIAGKTQSSTAHTPAAIGVRLVSIGNTLYLVKNGHRYGITSPGILYSYGWEFKDAKAAAAADSALPQGALLLPGNGYLVKSLKDATVYLISNDQRYGFTSEAVFKALGFSFGNVFVVTDPELQSLPKADNLSSGTVAHLPGTDINDQGTIYWLGLDHQKHGYPSLAVYNSWHKDKDFSNVVKANEADQALPVGVLVTERVVE